MTTKRTRRAKVGRVDVTVSRYNNAPIVGLGVVIQDAADFGRTVAVEMTAEGARRLASELTRCADMLDAQMARRRGEQPKEHTLFLVNHTIEEWHQGSMRKVPTGFRSGNCESCDVRLAPTQDRKEFEDFVRAHGGAKVLGLEE